MAKYKIHKAYHTRKHSYKIPHGVSKEETEVSNMIALEFPGTPIYRSDRTILHGREIDILLPTRKLGIEFDGNFYHNSSSKTANYHIYKTIEAEKQGYQLIHIFSDEWEQNKALVIDLIRKTLGKYQKIPVEHCKVCPILKAEGSGFLENACLLGNDTDATGFTGIFYNNDLIAVMSYKETNDEIEILRYEERRLLKVVNGLNKCIESFNKPLVAKVDRRLYKGWDFIDAGFKQVEATNPKTYYTKDYKHRILEKNMPSKSLENTSYVKIYDCGDIIYRKD